MSEELRNEIEAINSIYEADTLKTTETAGILILSIPSHQASLRLSIPPGYPETEPRILGIEGTGTNTKKGYGTYVFVVARECMLRIFTPGSVCLFDLLQELDTALSAESLGNTPSQLAENGKDENAALEHLSHLHPKMSEEPLWSLSAPVILKKSTFIARACAVETPAQAQACIAHLLSVDKRAAKATHNITAFRIRCTADVASVTELVYQDCDDDGESAAGGRLLHLLQVMDVWGVLVMVSRWYGGVKLGPDRFSIINNVAREAVIEGGWTRSRTTKD